ncbi:hypothetical protein AO063_10000 [Pseudomonas fluorescens ICMP 11288]|uniref:Peptidase M60 domain-containing protein n=2 Tax=Pseudomonas TaxID=286 RepID=A0A0W0I7E0_PSEFL|nr:hypothetical protein AO063_10000 [Pseudomonas fluorescens ICMP 11288]
MPLVRDLTLDANNQSRISLGVFDANGQLLGDWAPDATLTINLTIQDAGQVFNGTASYEDERIRTGCLQSLNDRQPTGFHVRRGDVLEVELTLIDTVGNSQPYLFIGAPDAESPEPGLWENVPTPIALNAGVNRLSNHKGGVVYFQLTGAGNTARLNFISGMQAVPTFEQGKHSIAQYQDMLIQNQGSRFAEYISNRVIITMPIEAAIKYQHINIDQLLNIYDRIIFLQEQFIGLDSSSALHSPSPPPAKNHLSISTVKLIQGAPAGHTHTAYGIYRADDMLDLAKLITYYVVWHETAHTYQMLGYMPSEDMHVFTQLASLYIQRHVVEPPPLQVYPILPRADFESALTKVNSPNLEHDQLTLNEKLVPLEQLRIFFGDEFWPRLNKITRERWRSNGEAPARSQAIDNLVLFSSIATNTDLRHFFSKWGLSVTPEGDQKINALYLQPPTMDLTTLRDPNPPRYIYE